MELLGFLKSRVWQRTHYQYLHKFKDRFLVSGLLEIISVDVGALEYMSSLQQLCDRLLYKLYLFLDFIFTAQNGTCQWSHLLHCRFVQRQFQLQEYTPAHDVNSREWSRSKVVGLQCCKWVLTVTLHANLLVFLVIFLQMYTDCGNMAEYNTLTW